MVLQKFILAVLEPHIEGSVTVNTGNVGIAPTITEKVAVAAVHGEFETVIVNVTVLPASPAADVYVGVNDPCPAVIEPAPFSVQLIVPLDELAPLTVAVPP